MDANELIDRMERETGQRVDDENSAALAGLLGAIAREMGKSRQREDDDVVAGVVIAHQLTPEYQREQQANKMIASLFLAGLSPEVVRDFGKL